MLLHLFCGDGINGEWNQSSFPPCFFFQAEGGQAQGPADGLLGAYAEVSPHVAHDAVRRRLFLRGFPLGVEALVEEAEVAALEHLFVHGSHQLRVGVYGIRQLLLLQAEIGETVTEA